MKFTIVNNPGKYQASIGKIEFKINVPLPPKAGEQGYNFFKDKNQTKTKRTLEVIKNFEDKVCGILVVYKDDKSLQNTAEYGTAGTKLITEEIEIPNFPKLTEKYISIIAVHEQEHDLGKKNILDALAYLIEILTPARDTEDCRRQENCRHKLESHDIRPLLVHILNGTNKIDNIEGGIPKEPLTSQGGVLKPGTI